MFNISKKTAIMLLETSNKLAETIPAAAWARIETITIDCLIHIRRGKVEKDDPLLKLLRQWLLNFNSNLMPLEKLAA
ncbi:MAG: hypothetical protein UR15_C0034G0010 [Parcubacteria group bacterium GW2011_GWA2_31_28]|nr:MAG: hypothetical protein UR15_C0034G0010 [Parcubacteria group bacterium GW2011_GWA2_31_28]